MVNIDFNTLNNNLSVRVLKLGVLEDILDGLGFDFGIRTTHRGIQYVGKCPIHGGNNPEHCIVYANDKISWKCFSRCCHDNKSTPAVKSSLIGFVRGCLNTQNGADVGFHAAYQFVKRFTTGDNPRPCRPTRPVIPKPSYDPLPQRPAMPFGQTPQDFREKYQLQVPSRFFAQERGFSHGILERLMVGYSMTERRVLCPFFSDDGNLIMGFMSRTHYPACDKCKGYHYPNKDCQWGQRHRWKTPDGFETGSFLYGYHIALQSKAPYVVLAEGIPDTLRCLESGHPAVACLGISLSEAQKNKLLALRKAVIVGFDSDRDGNLGAGNVVQELWKAETSRLVIPPPYKDLGEMPRSEAQQLLDGHVSSFYG